MAVFQTHTLLDWPVGAFRSKVLSPRVALSYTEIPSWKRTLPPSAFTLKNQNSSTLGSHQENREEVKWLPSDSTTALT